MLIRTKRRTPSAQRYHPIAVTGIGLAKVGGGGIKCERVLHKSRGFIHS